MFDILVRALINFPEYCRELIEPRDLIFNENSIYNSGLDIYLIFLCINSSAGEKDTRVVGRRLERGYWNGCVIERHLDRYYAISYATLYTSRRGHFFFLFSFIMNIHRERPHGPLSFISPLYRHLTPPPPSPLLCPSPRALSCAKIFGLALCYYIHG